MNIYIYIYVYDYIYPALICNWCKRECGFGECALVSAESISECGTSIKQHKHIIYCNYQVFQESDYQHIVYVILLKRIFLRSLQVLQEQSYPSRCSCHYSKAYIDCHFSVFGQQRDAPHRWGKISEAVVYSWIACVGGRDVWGNSFEHCSRNRLRLITYRCVGKSRTCLATHVIR